MKKLRAYSVKEEPNADWQVVVIAKSARRAKKLGYNSISSHFNKGEYTDCRVLWLKNIVVPDNTELEYVFDWCGGRFFMCHAWTECEETQCDNYANRLDRDWWDK